MLESEKRSMTVKTVRSKDGTAIAFDQLGEGPPLILVDGAFCSRAFGPMTPLAALLAPHFTVFTYDRRGRGDSGDTAPYAVQREVEDIEALIDEAGGSAFVYGASSGAALALEAAAQGLAITKLALYEPPYVNDNSGPPHLDNPENYIMQLTALIAADRRGDAVELFLTKAVGVPAEDVTSMRNSPMWPSLEAVAPTLAFDHAIMGDNSLPTERAASVTTPTLVMDGGASDPWMRNAVQALADALPNAQHYTLEGQTHEIKPELHAPVLTGFFKA